ncbi:hypothetical protein [Planotetraspora kaengkrachanensis]|uniref:Uncharacterized protein n=1 Tax=Planotetraspora kaengkrachanensis TaxID=575193 RepID=A0A8J3PRT9_9ACTN|nr:hypothetical protein [Planotetraspora kaengkrachanensis]GIG79562.1 hypothetical protein Pka01_26890 [Planotetraspora kaengkrachanensis]
MALTTRVKQFTESKPFYAFAGATSYAVEKLRKVPKQLRTGRHEVGETAKELPSRARKTVAENLPEPAREVTDTVTALLNVVYDELAVRGRKVVKQVSREAAQELGKVSETAKAATARDKQEAPARKPGRPASRTQRTKTASRA